MFAINELMFKTNELFINDIYNYILGMVRHYEGFKKCGIEPHNPLVFSEHDFAAAKTTDHDVVGDKTENNSANPQTLVV